MKVRDLIGDWQRKRAAGEAAPRILPENQKQQAPFCASCMQPITEEVVTRPGEINLHPGFCQTRWERKFGKVAE